jgi:cytochrome c-type biogenesis protein CcmF
VVRARWGGYWAWDPVENAALLPWLTGTAALHSLMVQERRGTLKTWNVSLALITGIHAFLATVAEASVPEDHRDHWSQRSA